MWRVLMVTALTLGLVPSANAQACPVDDDVAVSSGASVQDVKGEFVHWATSAFVLGLATAVPILLRSKHKESGGVDSLNLSNEDEKRPSPDTMTIELSLLALEFDQVSLEKGDVDEEIAVSS